MLSMQEILKLPQDEQVAIMEAIQDNLDDFKTDEKLSEDNIAFIKERISSIGNLIEPEYTWSK